MKNLFLVLCMAFSALSVNAEIGPVNRSTNVDYAGAVVNGTKEQRFINVINASGVSIAVGKAVVWDLTADDGASVTTSTTATNTPACIMAVTCAAAKLCKCQVYGYFSAVLFDSTNNNATAGKRVYLSTRNAGYVAARGTELATEVPIGIFYDSASASGAVEMFIDK